MSIISLKNCGYNLIDWLPTSVKEVELRGWNELDVILFCGDAYVDHPSFGMAIISRILENIGLRVAIVPQPNWKDDLRDFKKLGKPKLFFGVSAGNIDSMVNHYTATKRLRSNDAYTPNGQKGFRPDYPTIVYTKILKKLFPYSYVIIGGLEASLRRFAHYDYWEDQVKNSILIDSGADMLIYGMAEKPLIELVNRIKKGEDIKMIKNIPQTAICEINYIPQNNDIVLEDAENCKKNKEIYNETYKIIELSSNHISNKRIVQPHANKYLIVNPPYPPLETNEINEIYSLPYTRLPHPRYFKRGPIPAYEMIKHSITIHRGCFGGCSFCAITLHQGKYISSRSIDNIIREAEKISNQPDFKGTISDVGGPTANMYYMGGINKNRCLKCNRPSCIYPNICNNLNYNHSQLLTLYDSLKKIKKIKKIFVSSGVRYDLLITNDKTIDKKNNLSNYTKNLILNHVSGRLKVAPEHSNSYVLKLARKHPFSIFLQFRKIFYEISFNNNLNLQLTPYLIAALPGCSIKEMKELSETLRKLNIKVEQVQIFTPTPMTLSSTMYYTGKDPYTKETIYIERDINMKKKQKDLFFFFK